MGEIGQYQPFVAEVTLGAGDATKTLKAATTGVSYVVTGVYATCLVSAAQTVFVGDSSGTVKALSIAASFTLHNQVRTGPLNRAGLVLTEGEALIVKPAAAGPSFHVVVEGYLKKSSTAFV